MYGYNGKVLQVNLEDGSVKTEFFDENWYRLYAGGGLMGGFFLLRDTPAGLDAFDPGNVLVFASSVIAGLNGPGLSRFSVVSKSPLSGGIGESRCEGPFGAALKSSGFDAVVIKGKPKAAAYLLIENGQAKICDAQTIWGTNTNEATTWLEKKHGKEAQIAVIGPAGENLVRYASIVTDYSVQALRSGTGGVMGSKLLKAVVIKGGKSPAISNENGLALLRSEFLEAMKQNTLSMWQKNPPGFGASADLSDYDTAYIGRCNYKGNMQVEDSAFHRENYMPYYSGEIACVGCPNDCIKIISPDKKPNDKSAGIHQEVTGALGPNIGNNNLELMLRANVVCNLYGIDPVSLGFTLSFAMEAFDNGLLDLDKTNGIQLCFGNEEAILPVIDQIVRREGIGDLLAEGCKRASEQLGGGSEKYALHVKGVEMVSFEPRTQTNLALGYATAPVGPRYDICEHDWDFDVVSGWDHTLINSGALGINQRIPMEYLGKDKVRNYKALNTVWSACDALNLCVFASAPTRVLSLEMITRLISAITGWNTSSYEFMGWGERRNQLMRVYNLREGIGREQDTLPERFFSLPISSGRLAGTVLDRQLFKEVIDCYYEMMGWDTNGVPLAGTLYGQGLDFLVPVLAAIGD